MITRDNIIEHLIPYFDKDNRYYLLVCDCGFAKIDTLKAKYPDRIINMGIMEQGTVGIASGMAQAGLIPIIYSIASFIVWRALEQIKIDIVDMDRNVKIIGNGTGDFFKSLGECHHCRDNDIKLLNVAGMPVYHNDEFTAWINSKDGGFIRV